jgi:hypothetical protein
MIELGVEHYTGMDTFKGPSMKLGSKPCMIFVGDQWEYEEPFVRMQSLFTGSRCVALGLPYCTS